MIAKTIWHKALDVLFPVECFGCHLFGTWICDKCSGNIPLNSQFICPLCGHPSFNGRTCFSCQPKTALDGAWIAGVYDTQLLRRLIRAYKYQYVRDIGVPLSAKMIQYMYSLQHIGLKLHTFDCVVPIPLHPIRFLKRGYNQSEVLAQRVADFLEVPLSSDLLIRKKQTKPQVELSPEQRRVSVRGSFEMNHQIRANAKSVLLIDDVLTTGSTLSEAAKALKQGGVDFVWAMVLAKG